LLIADSINDRYFKSIILYDIGLVYFSLGKYTQALDVLNRSLAIKEDINFTQGIPNALILIGKIYEMYGEPEKANELYIRGMKISYGLKDKHLLVKSLNGIAGNLLKMQHYEDALDYLNQSLEIAENIGAKSEMSDIYREMSLTYASLHQLDSAEVYLNLFLDMEDLLQLDESALNAFANSLYVIDSTTITKDTTDEFAKRLPTSSPDTEKPLTVFFMSWIIMLILLIGISIIIFVIFATGIIYGKRKN